jgi:sec-independent protein translocase protein TatB
MVSQFTSELDRQLKADELRKELREAGDVGLEDVQKTVRGALDEAKKYEHMMLSDDKVKPSRPAPATRRQAAAQTPDAVATDTVPASPSPTTTPQDKSSENHS